MLVTELLRRAGLARKDAALSARENAEWRRQRCLELARAYERAADRLAQASLPV